MPEPEYIRIPLRRRDGSIRAYALIDTADAHLAELRWCLKPGGYAVRTVRGQPSRTVFLHRVLLGLAHGDPRTGDHINRDRLDNRRANLRIVTRAEQQQNQGSRGGSSRFRGVTWDRKNKKWIAQCKLNGRCRFLGHYVDEAEAGAVAAAFRAKHMPISTD